MSSLQAFSADPNLTQTVTLTFTGAGTFNVTGTGTGNPTNMAYAPGQAITYNGWSLALRARPRSATPSRWRQHLPEHHGGNAEALLAVRDTPMFDGAPASEGYAMA